MKGKGRTILLHFGSTMLVLAVMMLLPTVSEAQYARKVPEPGTSALLMTGMAGIYPPSGLLAAAS